VHVRGLEIVGRELFMIRPPRSRFSFTHIHGITWAHVRAEPSFAELWPVIAARLAAASFLAAHNASFDRGVLAACCAGAGADPPAQDFLCTVRLARRAWSLKRANLPAVCAHLGIALNHHDPASDAEACARIVIAARREASPSLRWRPRDAGAADRFRSRDPSPSEARATPPPLSSSIAQRSEGNFPAPAQFHCPAQRGQPISTFPGTISWTGCPSQSGAS